MRWVSPLLFHQPAKVFFESHLRPRRSVERAWFNTHPAIGFPEAIGIPRLLDAIGLDAVEELVAIK